MVRVCYDLIRVRHQRYLVKSKYVLIDVKEPPKVTNTVVFSSRNVFEFGHPKADPNRKCVSVLLVVGKIGIE